MRLSIQLLKCGVFLVRFVPVKVADKIAVLIGSVSSHMLVGRRHIIEKNLYYIFSGENIDREHFNRIVKATFVNYARIMVDFFRLGSMSKKEDFDVEPYVLESALSGLSYKRGCVLITMHLGCWDYAGAYLAAIGLPMSALVEETDPEMLSLYTKHREHTGMKTFPLSRAAYAFVDTIKNNRILAILADRDIVGNGTPIGFFSGRRKIPSGLAAIIIRKKLPVLFGYMVLNPSHKQRYLGVIEPPIIFEGDENEFNRFMVSKFEEIIRRYPDQWFVFQPKWIE
jgi:lauroyl/myristoyl acyltransferase